ncbi:MAG TPA: hypothetical protein VI643_01800 [Planctomycetota bacterium]|nr:hypothetical protein [Planctomycetota bacterium]
MADLHRVRWAHLSSQLLAVLGVVAVMSAGGEALTAWGIPSKQYAIEFNAHLADLEVGRAVSPVEKKGFLAKHAPHQLELESAFLRLVALVAFMLIVPVGVGAYTHAAYSRDAADRESAAAAQGLKTLAWVEGALAAVSLLGVLIALILGGARRSPAEAQVEAMRLLDSPSADQLKESFVAVRDSGRAVRTGVTIAFSVVGVAFLMGICLYLAGAKLIAGDRRNLERPAADDA